ncbi:MAG: TolC family protein, partial [Hyphomicrobiales bacterium]|nr:TolC family protein [Hyphomicrobiales bacterium]
MRRLESALAALGLALLAGCASEPANQAPDAPDRPWVPPASAGAPATSSNGATPGKAQYVLPPNPSLSSLQPPPTVDPNKAYSLADLVDLAETSNPLTRIAWEEAIKSAEAAGIA